MIGFLNVVSSAAPPRDSQYKIGVVAFALAVEDEAGQIVRTLVRRVALPGDRALDLEWMTRYGIADFNGEDGVEPAQAAGEVIAALRGVTQTAAHFVQFHRKHLERMILDGAGALDVPEIADMDWFDTMHKSTHAVGIPARTGRALKPPSLKEAFEYLTSTPLPDIAGMPWQAALLSNLSAVRTIYHRLHGKPAPAPIELVPEAIP